MVLSGILVRLYKERPLISHRHWFGIRKKSSAENCGEDVELSQVLSVICRSPLLDTDDCKALAALQVIRFSYNPWP